MQDIAEYLEMHQCFLSYNRYTAIQFNIGGRLSFKSSIYISQSSFERNVRCVAVYYHDYRPLSATELIIRSNTFARNTGTVIYIRRAWYSWYWDYSLSMVRIPIKDNLFLKNRIYGSQNGILDISGRAFSIMVTKNSFMRNRCSFVGKFTIISQFQNHSLHYTNNTFRENEGVSGSLQEYFPYTNISSFTLGIFGYWLSNYKFHYNVLRNERMHVELFVGRPCGFNFVH